MIELKFEVSDEALVTNIPVEEIPRGVLVETVFLVPVYLLVNSVNVLGFPNGGTLTLPLLGFATSLSEVIDKLTPGQREKMAIADGGCLFLERVEGEVRFWTTTLDRNVAAPYDETVAAVQTFLGEVKRVLEARVPSIRNHPHWHKWFPGDQPRQQATWHGRH